MTPEKDAGFAVSMDSGEPDVVGFGVTIPLDEWQSLLNNLPSKERKEFLYDLRLRLIHFKGVGFSIPLDSLPSITFTYHIYLEELTRTTFWDAVNLIFNSISVTLWMFEKKFNLEGNKPFIKTDVSGVGH